MALHDSEAAAETITVRQAFLAMCDYLWEFGNTGNDLLTLLGDTELTPSGRPTDPAAWTDWLASVRKILAGGEPREPRPTGGFLEFRRH